MGSTADLRQVTITSGPRSDIELNQPLIVTFNGNIQIEMERVEAESGRGWDTHQWVFKGWVLSPGHKMYVSGYYRTDERKGFFRSAVKA